MAAHMLPQVLCWSPREDFVHYLSILRTWQLNTKGLFLAWVQGENLMEYTGYARTQICTEKVYLLHSLGLPFRICYFEQWLQLLSWSPLFHTWNFPLETGLENFTLTELFPTDLAIHMADVVSEIKGSGGFSFCEVWFCPGFDFHLYGKKLAPSRFSECTYKKLPQKNWN